MFFLPLCDKGKTLQKELQFFPLELFSGLSNINMAWVDQLNREDGKVQD